MREASEAGDRRLFGNRPHSQHSLLLAIGIQAPASPEDAFAVLPKDLKADARVGVEARPWVHLPCSANALWTDRAIMHPK
jgi:hypothetical protein